MLKVHFVANTRAGRVVWLLEELGLEYEVNIMPFTKEGQGLRVAHVSNGWSGAYDGASKCIF